MNPPSNNNDDSKAARGNTIMLGSDFFGGPRGRDSLDLQQESPAGSRRGSVDGSGGGEGGDAASAQARQQHRARFWGSIGAAQVDCTAAPFSA